jgi:hypothetical protein
MKTALPVLGCLLAGFVGQQAIAAEFDTLTVVVNGTGLKEFKKTVNMGETLTISYPGNNPEVVGDILTIPAFTIELMSDSDPSVGATTTAEGAGLSIDAVALSDVSRLNSDSLSFEDTMDRKRSVFLKEKDEKGSGFTEVPLDYPGATISFGSDENGNSDTLFIPAFTMKLKSDGMVGDTGPDLGEDLRWSIDISASSDSNVPEPATWVMMLLGFAGLGFIAYRASRRGVEPIA